LTGLSSQFHYTYDVKMDKASDCGTQSKERR